MVLIHMAAPGYFKTMGIPVKRGRDFTERDAFSAPPVLIVNEALARQYFPNEDPIGKRWRRASRRYRCATMTPGCARSSAWWPT